MELPIVIKKHWTGYVLIVGVGIAVLALIWSGIISMWRSGDLTQDTYWMLGIASILVLLVTMVTAYIYSLSYIELSTEGIKVQNWLTLFVSGDARTSWGKVQDVYRTTDTIFSLLFNYGTLTIQTAGTGQHLTLTMVPDAEYWQSVILAYAESGELSTALVEA